MLTDGLAQKRLQISGWLVTEKRDTPYEGSTKVQNPLQERTDIRVWLLSADVRLGRLYGLQVSTAFPDVTRSAVVTLPGGTFNFSETFRGVGDTSLIVWKRFVSSTGWNITLSGGTSLPTGKTEMPRFRSEDDDGSLVPVSRLQRGTGTFDPLVGLSANRIVERIFRPGVRTFVNVAARLPVAENEHGLRTGAAIEAAAGASREVWFHELVVIGRMSWLHREPDVFEGTPVLVGGGDWIYLAPAAAWSYGNLTIQGEIKVPLYRSLDNRQLDSARLFQLGVTWTY